MKKVVSILGIIAIICTLMPISMGASFKFEPTISATKVDAGSTITINLKLSDIDAGEKGINTFKCTFLYNKDIFEDVSVSSKNNWSITYNNQEGNPQYGTLLAVLIATGVTNDQEIGTITLKVKEGTEGKNGEISFTSVSTNDGEVEIPETDKVLTVAVNDPNAGSGSGQGGTGTGEGSGSGTGTGEGSGSGTGTGEVRSGRYGSFKLLQSYYKNWL